MTTPTTTAPTTPATETAAPAKATRPRKPRAAAQPPVTPPAPAVAPKPAAAKKTPAKAAPAPAPAPAPEPKKPTTADYRNEIDQAIIRAAGELVKQMVPADLHGHVSQLIANQLHHLSTPKQGWPSDILPRPNRSEWR